MALASPAKLIYLSMVEVTVIPATIKAAIDKRKGKIFNLTDILVFLRVIIMKLTLDVNFE